jgi:hybrid polyketide synthase/nonribosomal peptide synthetase ACE1
MSSSDKSFSYGPDADFNIMRAVGENLPAVIRGETSMLEHMVKDERLDNYYKDALGFEHAYDVTTDMFTQFVHRYPHMNIIEVGSGTGRRPNITFKHTITHLMQVEQLYLS